MSSSQRSRASAEPLYQEALRLEPNNAQTLNLLGALYYELKKFDRARDMLERSNALQPTNLPTQTILGVVYSKLNQFDLALHYLRGVAAASPTSAEAQFNLGGALSDSGKRKDAILAFERAYALNPDHPASLSSIASCHELDGRLDVAEKVLRRCVTSLPGSLVPSHRRLRLTESLDLKRSILGSWKRS